MRSFLRIVTFGLGAALLFGHLGALHPALDAFSNLRLQLLGLAAGATILLVIVRMRRVATILGAITIGSAALTWPWLAGRAEEHMAMLDGSQTFDGTQTVEIVLLQQNLRFRNQDVDAIIARVSEVDPDLVALQELRDANLVALDRLRPRYSFQHRCRGASRAGDVALLSRHPFAPDIARRCTPGLAVAAFSVEGMAVAVGSLHLHWPWPFDQPSHVEAITPLVAMIGEPGVLAGDFNAVTWSHAVARIAGAMNGHIVRGIGLTRRDPALPDWLEPLWDIPIDQAIVTDRVRVLGTRTLVLDGSDHDTVVTHLAVPRAMPDPNETDMMAKQSRHHDSHRGLSTEGGMIGTGTTGTGDIKSMTSEPIAEA